MHHPLYNGGEPIKPSERTYTVNLERTKTGSFVTIPVRAVSISQAQRKAAREMPGWQVLNAA